MGVPKMVKTDEDIYIFLYIFRMDQDIKNLMMLLKKIHFSTL